MSEESGTYQCWLNESEKILSFKTVTGYSHHEFAIYDDYIKFVFDIIDNQHYRVQ